jgi:recombination protein RecA
MRALLSKAEIESGISDRLSTAFKLREKAPAEVLSTGIPEVDAITSGLPRGAITEVFGATSSGRTSFMLAALAHATNEQEVCALVDTNDSFDAVTAMGAGIVFDQLLWVRCGGEEMPNLPEGKKIERAFKAADLLLQSGGFGLVVLDLADIVSRDVRRIISSWWFRFRRAIENTPTALVVTAQASCAGSRAALALELRKEKEMWTSANGSLVFPGLDQKLKTNILLPPFTHSIPAAHSSVPVVSYLAATNLSMPPTIHPRITHSNLLRGLHFNLERQKPISLKNRQTHFHTSAQR